MSCWQSRCFCVGGRGSAQRRPRPGCVVRAWTGGSWVKRRCHGPASSARQLQRLPPSAIASVRVLASRARSPPVSFCPLVFSLLLLLLLLLYLFIVLPHFMHFFGSRFCRLFSSWIWVGCDLRTGQVCLR